MRDTKKNIYFSYFLQVDDMAAAHSIGTAAVVVQVTGTNWPRPAYTLLATGLCRFKIDDFLQESPYAVARVTQLDKLSEEEGKGISTSYKYFFCDV